MLQMPKYHDMTVLFYTEETYKLSHFFNTNGRFYGDF